jgi:hypothetical protein
MPALEKESRDDDNLVPTSRMPDVIHLAPTLHVHSPNEPLIIEDLTGYEIIKGTYYLVITVEQSEENLVMGQRLGPMVLPSSSLHQPSQNQDSERRQRPFLEPELKYGDVTKAISLLRLPHNLSDITFMEENECGPPESSFERVRMSL